MKIVNRRHRAAIQPKAREASTFARCAPTQEVMQFERWSMGRAGAPRKCPPVDGYDTSANEQYPKAA